MPLVQCFTFHVAASTPFVKPGRIDRKRVYVHVFICEISTFLGFDWHFHKKYRCYCDYSENRVIGGSNEKVKVKR
jgi:hypothetical protein